MRRALFLRGICASDVAAGGADILQQMQSQRNLLRTCCDSWRHRYDEVNPISNALYACGAVACIADMVGKESLKGIVPKKPFTHVLR